MYAFSLMPSAQRHVPILLVRNLEGKPTHSMDFSVSFILHPSQACKPARGKLFKGAVLYLHVLCTSGDVVPVDLVRTRVT